MKKSLILIATLTLLIACSGGQSDSADTGTPPKTEQETAQAPSTQEEPQEAANIRNALKFDLLKDDLEFIPEENRRFSYEMIDLNGDGKNEYLIGLQNSYFCGTGGCTFILLDHEGNQVTRFSVSRSPFIVLSEQTKGWNDLLVYSGSAMRKLTFDGSTYPSNPSTEPEYTATPGDDLRRLLDSDASPSPIPEFEF